MTKKAPFKSIYNLFFEPRDVVEIRSFGLHGNSKCYSGYAGGGAGTVFGYFDNPDDFAGAANSLNNLNPQGIYFTINPCLPALIARAKNRLVAADRNRSATGDKWIKCIRWLLIDLDPVRPSGISSSDEELSAARKVAENVVSFLEGEIGFPEGVMAMSGNGYHLLYRLPDLPNSPDVSGSGGLVFRMLSAIESKCATDRVNVDLKVFNPARIWKLYGTFARKGDHTEDRQHRQSQLLTHKGMHLNKVKIVPTNICQKLAALAPAKDKIEGPGQARKMPRDSKYRSELNKECIEIEKYLQHYGKKIQKIKRIKEATWYFLSQCVFDEAHTGGVAAIVQSPNPPYLTYDCKHDSCRHHTWKEARHEISGDEALSSFCNKLIPHNSPTFKTENSSLHRESILTDRTESFLEADIVEQGTEIIEGDTTKVEHPKKVDPKIFFKLTHNKHGARARFTVVRLVKYLCLYLHPIRHTNGSFWRYQGGVWRILSRYEIDKTSQATLKEYLQPSWLVGAQQILAARVNQEETVWQPPENLINLKNGMLDISSEPVELKEHRPEYWHRTQLPVKWDPEATCENFLRMLGEVFPEPNGIGKAKYRVLQEFFGYCLLPTCKHEKALFMYGGGANGKSIILNSLEHCIGTENISAVSLEGLAHRFTIPVLQNKMVNIASEVDTREKAGTENLKKGISGDLLQGEIKNGATVMFRSFVKFIFAMNSPPTITDKTYGFSRKVIVLNFNRRFEESERDRDLGTKLLSELPGILNWAIEGAKRLMRQGGFSLEDSIKHESDAFMAQINPVLIFIKEECIRSQEVYSTKKRFYLAYKEWSMQCGYRALAMGNFYEQIQSNCPDVKVNRKTISGSKPWVFEGIGLKEEWSEILET